MTEVTFKYDPILFKKAIRNYLEFVWKRETKKGPLVLGLLTCVIISGIGKHFGIMLLTYLGILGALVGTLILLIYLLKFLFLFLYFRNTLQLNISNLGKEMKFFFNEEMFGTEAPNSLIETKWDSVGKFMINDRDIYLFDKKEILIMIVSAQIIGNDNFESFKEIVAKKVA